MSSRIAPFPQVSHRTVSRAGTLCALALFAGQGCTT
jgi:hypothetical protein